MLRTSLIALLLVAQEATPVAVPVPYAEELAGTTLAIDMSPIPGGTLLTAGGPVELAPFYMATLETSWDLYDVMVYGYDLPRGEEPTDGVTRPTRPYIAADRGYGHAGYPALSLSHNGAEAYCEWLRIKTGRRYRLPTEHEWEWACRATSTESPFSNADVDALQARAWLKPNSDRKTHPIGEKEPNTWGLFDMVGNVAEWCTTANGGHALRGGSFKDRLSDLGEAERKVPTPAWNQNDPQIPKSIWWLTDGAFVGFRVICEMDQGAPAEVTTETDSE